MLAIALLLYMVLLQFMFTVFPAMLVRGLKKTLCL